MSELVPSRPQASDAQRRFAIVASKFNSEYVHGLVSHAIAELRASATNVDFTVHEVPGAFEIPVVVRELAKRKAVDAVLAIGVILKGHTDHARYLAGAVTDALQRIAIEEGVPVINCILSMENEAQARERCLENKINRGTEAARAAIDIANVMIDLRAE